MNASAESTEMPAPPARDAWRPLRYLLRTPLLALHLLITLPLALLVINPIGATLGWRGETLAARTTRWWSGKLVRLFGFRIRRIGEPVPGAVLFVANHVSWMDIELMHSQRMMSFVAKAEIERWPVIGWLASRAGTIFHRRGSTHSLATVMAVVVERLQSGVSVGVFPEGGTGPGDRVRTFHARIFQVALDAGVPVQPIALCYGRDGRMDTSVAFAANESFFGNFLRVLGGPSLDAEVHFLAPVPVDGEGRRRLAERARAQIAAELGFTEGSG
jgi:1-acyl-sn-glycerol-3-phosphate acyltransferase